MGKPKEILELEEIYGITLKEMVLGLYSNCYQLNNKGEIIGLDLSGNLIGDIKPLQKLTRLTKLDLYRNQISDIKPLQKLKRLTWLDLSQNQIYDIKPLRRLTQLKVLKIYGNCFSEPSLKSVENNLRDVKIYFQILEGFKPKEIIEIEKIYGIRLDEMVHSGYKPHNYYQLDSNKKIIVLNLAYNQISDIAPLRELKLLTKLHLENNQISDITPLQELKQLTELYLSINQISDIKPLQELKQLRTLDLYKNQISNITPLQGLTQLTWLALSNNQISDITPLQELTKLKELYIYYNKLPELSLSSCDNLQLVLKYLSEKKLEQKIFKLPAKIMLLGNHAAGKSSFLYYLKNKKLADSGKIPSTHILTIEQYNLPTQYKEQENKTILPDAMIYDFGGHDYYHGIYSAFLSQKAITVLLWCKEFDKNEVGNTKNNLGFTRNFTRNYWLHQLKASVLKENETVLMVQTHADEEDNKRENYTENYSDFNISNEYYLSFDKDYVAEHKQLKRKLTDLKEDLIDEIILKRNESEEERPKFYEKFLDYVIGYKKSECVKVEDIFKNHYSNLREKNEGENDAILCSYLKIDLDKLHHAGMIIYYKEDEELKDIVWLNPQKTVEYIHKDILKQEFIIKNDGKIKEKDFDALFDSDNKIKIKKMLIHQKVIFHDEGDKKYIVPGYLPLTTNKDYYLTTFTFSENFNFKLKFKNFLPFGLINQLICLYGGQPDIKEFWRDQLIFTFDNQYIIKIRLDFSSLEIVVYIQQKKGEIPHLSLAELEKLIFMNIIDLYSDYCDEIKYYWDENKILRIKSKGTAFLVDSSGKYMVSNNDDSIFLCANNTAEADSTIKEYLQQKIFNSPKDLYISVDGEYFVHHQELENINDYKANIPTYTIKANTKELDTVSHHTKPINLYKSFTNNQILQNMKKIFISYSSADKKEMHEFYKHTVTLQEQGLIAKPWTDEWINFSQEWDEEIKRQIKECDIMVCLISVDFLNTDYIRKTELIEAMKQDKLLVPIIVKPCDWENCDFAKYQVALKGKCISLNENQEYTIKENSDVERAKFWVEIIKEMRKKIFNKN